MSLSLVATRGFRLGDTIPTVIEITTGRYYAFEEGVIGRARLYGAPNDEVGYAYPALLNVIEAVSDENGYLEFPGMKLGRTYAIRIGIGDEQLVTIPADAGSITNLNSILE